MQHTTSVAAVVLNRGGSSSGRPASEPKLGGGGGTAQGQHGGCKAVEEGGATGRQVGSGASDHARPCTDTAGLWKRLAATEQALPLSAGAAQANGGAPEQQLKQQQKKRKLEAAAAAAAADDGPQAAAPAAEQPPAAGEQAAADADERDNVRAQKQKKQKGPGGMEVERHTTTVSGIMSQQVRGPGRGWGTLGWVGSKGAPTTRLSNVCDFLAAAALPVGKPAPSGRLAHALPGCNARCPADV